MRLVRLIILSFFIFFLVSFAHAQVEVEYNINYNGISKSTVKLSQAALSYRKNFIEPSLDIINASVGILNVCDNQSYFSVISRPNDDLNNNAFAKSFIESSSWLTSSSESGNVDVRKRRLVIADYNKESWSIQRDAKVIAGYSCFKATKQFVSKEFPKINRQLEVWFTPDLPVDSGFIDATGLPGLVLYYNDQILELTAFKVSTLKKCNINVPKLDRISFTHFNKEAAARMEQRRNSKK